MSRLPKGPLRLASSTLLAAALVAGCIPVPIPTQQTAPRFSPEQIGGIRRDTPSRDAVRVKLGAPDIRREDDRVWIYHWTITSGMWFGIPLAPLVAGDLGPITSDTAVLVLTFDHSGAVLSTELAREGTDGVKRRYCTETGLCLEYQVATGVDRGGSGLVSYNFHDQFSAVTVKGKMQDRFVPPEPSSDQCLVAIWPDQQDWTQSTWRYPAAGGLIVSVGTERNSWLPVGAFAEMVLPPGKHVVQAVSPWFADSILQPQDWPKGGLPKSSATFECRAGEGIYMAIGASGAPGNQFPIVLRRIDPASAQALITNMPRVLVSRRPAAPQ